MFRDFWMLRFRLCSGRCWKPFFAGVYRGVSFPAGFPVYVDTGDRRSGIVDRYVLLYADAGFLNQYADFVCLGARYRYRGG